MIPLLDLPQDQEGWEPGRFHFITRGFYCSLEPRIVIFFCGRLPHGGTAPLAPPNKTAPRWAIRFVLIGYPPRVLVEGNAHHTLGALADTPHDAEPIYLTPEMTSMKLVKILCILCGSTNRLT